MIKYKSTSEIEKFRAKLVAKRFSQKEGIYYQETFIPVVEIVTLRIVLSIATSKGWHIHQMDVFNTFLQSDLHDKIYIELP